ncbi:MAG: hypothetical protein AAF960_23580 [Bacteroidota bacterium]
MKHQPQIKSITFLIIAFVAFTTTATGREDLSLSNPNDTIDSKEATAQIEATRLLEMADQMQHSEKIDSALFFLNEIRLLDDIQRHKLILATTYEKLSAIYTERGRFEAASAAKDSLLLIKAQLFEESKTKIAEELEARYNSQQKTIDASKQEMLIDQKSNHLKVMLGGMLLLVACFLVAFLFFAYQNYLSKKNSNVLFDAILHQIKAINPQKVTAEAANSYPPLKKETKDLFPQNLEQPYQNILTNLAYLQTFMEQPYANKGIRAKELENFNKGLMQDLQTPINQIKQTLKTLKGEKDQITSKDHLENTYKLIAHSTQLIEDMLVVSVNFQDVNKQLEWIDLPTLFDKIKHVLLKQSNTKAIKIDYTLTVATLKSNRPLLEKIFLRVMSYLCQYEETSNCFELSISTQTKNKSVITHFENKFVTATDSYFSHKPFFYQDKDFKLVQLMLKKLNSRIEAHENSITITHPLFP